MRRYYTKVILSESMMIQDLNNRDQVSSLMSTKDLAIYRELGDPFVTVERTGLDASPALRLDLPMTKVRNAVVMQAAQVKLWYPSKDATPS